MGRETGLQTLFSVFHWFEFNVEDCRLLKSALVSVDFGGVKEVKLFSVPRLYHVLPKCRMPSRNWSCRFQPARSPALIVVMV